MEEKTKKKDDQRTIPVSLQEVPGGGYMTFLLMAILTVKEAGEIQSLYFPCYT